MENAAANLTEKSLCDQVVQGVKAAATLQKEYRIPLERFLVSRCDREDGRSRERAVEIASQVLAECFTKSPSLLERWRGEGNLESFLRTAAYNRLRSWWQSAEKRTTDVDSDSRAMELYAPADSDEYDADELAIAARALTTGVQAASKQCPEGLVFLRLKGLHGVDQRLISTCWGHHESQTSRRIKEAMDCIRSTALKVAEVDGCVLDAELLHHALQKSPVTLLGEGGDMPETSEINVLHELAGGNSTAQIRAKSISLMCAKPQALEFFSQLLNQQGSDRPVFPMDPEMQSTAARLSGMMARSLGHIRPDDLRKLMTPLMREAFADTLRAIGADGGTLWYSCPNEAALEAVFNPFELEIEGKRQPLVSGIISLTLATGEAFLSSNVASEDHHSPAIDIALGTPTRSMISVPFKPTGDTRGVLTAVRLRSEVGFCNNDKQELERHSEIQSMLLLSSISTVIRE